MPRLSLKAALERRHRGVRCESGLWWLVTAGVASLSRANPLHRQLWIALAHLAHSAAFSREQGEHSSSFSGRGRRNVDASQLAQKGYEVSADPKRTRLWDSVWSWGGSRCEVCSKDLGRGNSFEWLARGFFV